MSFEKIMSLVRLATNEATPREEARTAAMLALKLIAAGHAEIVPKREKFTFDYEGLLRDLAQQSEHVHSEYVRPRTQPTPRARPRRPVSRPESSRQSDPESVCVAKAAGFCSHCGDTYRKGESVVFLKVERQFVHAGCWTKRNF